MMETNRQTIPSLFEILHKSIIKAVAKQSKLIRYAYN